MTDNKTAEHNDRRNGNVHRPGEKNRRLKIMAKKSYSERNLKFETLQLHVGQETPDPVTDARAVPIYLTSSYVFHNSQHAADRFGLRDAGNIYGRLTNPTEDIFEKRIAALEGGVAALAVGSGAAALTYALQAVAHKGDHIVAAKNIYGGTYNLLAHTLPDFGIETTFVDPFDYDAIEAAIQDNTTGIEIETLGNPNSEVVDIERIAKKRILQVPPDMVIPMTDEMHSNAHFSSSSAYDGSTNFTSILATSSAFTAAVRRRSIPCTTGWSVR